MIALLLLAILITLLGLWAWVPWVLGAWLLLWIVTAPIRWGFAWDQRRFDRWTAARWRALDEAGQAVKAALAYQAFTPEDPEGWSRAWDAKHAEAEVLQARYNELSRTTVLEFYQRYLDGPQNAANRLRWMVGEGPSSL